jgi:hypothetical protein
MRTGRTGNQRVNNEQAVANLIEYVMISGVLMTLLMIMMMLVNSSIMQTPADRLSYVAFTDIGNGISTRIVDVYAIAPADGSITTRFDIPDDIANKGYFVEIGPGANPVDQNVRVYRDFLSTEVSLAGIGATRGVAGNTTGTGLNTISFNSAGY